MNDRALDRLFRRYRDRADGAALAAVFDATSRELLDVACHLMRDPAAAEDVLQETFLAALRGASRWDAERPVKAWLYGILVREAARARRSAARSVDHARLAEREATEPVQDLLDRELPAEVGRALARLPEHYREVLEPLVRDGRTPDEIARAVGRGAGTVRSQIHRGLERLRRLLPAGLASHAAAPWQSGRPVRGLAVVRDEVLGKAGMGAKASLAAFGTAKGALATVALGVVSVVGWLAWSGGGRAPDVPSFALPESGAPLDLEVARASIPERDPREEATERTRVETPSTEAPRPAEETTESLDYWRARFDEAPDDWRHGWAVAEDIARLPPDEGLAVMTGVWPHLSEAVKAQALKPFVFEQGHLHALPILHLAATDASLDLQGRALGYLSEYALRDFTTDYSAYLAWESANRDRPLADVLTDSAARLANDLQTLPADEAAQLLRSLERVKFDRGDLVDLDLRSLLRERGALAGLSARLREGDVAAARAALRCATNLAADEAWLRTNVLPAVQSPEGVDPELLDAHVRALGRRDCAWAREPLEGYLRQLGMRAADAARQGTGSLEEEQGRGIAAARALAEIGDPAAIPDLIGILAGADGTLDYAVGHFGLAKLTGVAWQEGHDAEWWLDWWEKNRGRLPAEVRSALLPLK